MECMNKHIDLSTSSSTLRNKKNANRLEVINNFCRKTLLFFKYYSHQNDA